MISREIKRLPDWLRQGHSHKAMRPTRGLLRELGLNTVCEEARCPNKTNCFSKPTAAFMILGDICTRGCGFCSVTCGVPAPPDPLEPENIAIASKQMGLKYIVITSVTRDDLKDGGAGQFVKTINAVREALPDAKVEVLTPDFSGDMDSLGIVLDASPDVFNHNIETVPSLYPTVRAKADYKRSLRVLHYASTHTGIAHVKSGIMLGLGETYDEVVEVFKDLRDVGCDTLTIGQYLKPSRRGIEVKEYIEPEVFDKLKGEAEAMGFGFVASGPLVRSSMNAEELYNIDKGKD